MKLRPFLALNAALVLAACRLRAADDAADWRFEDCNPALASRLILDGGLVLEVEARDGPPSIAGAEVVTVDRALAAVRRRCGGAPCPVVLFSDDGTLSALAKQRLLAGGYRATNLGGVAAWRHVSARARSALSSGDPSP